MSKISNNAHYFIAGAGLYYGLSWIFSFYPAFIIGLFACQLSNSPADGTPEMTGLIVMLIAYGVIQVLFACEKYVAVGIIFSFTMALAVLFTCSQHGRSSIKSIGIGYT